jgi:hypothetical protein
MGLLMDKNGIPMAFDLFPGNESEKVHMRPIINRVKDEFDDCSKAFGLALNLQNRKQQDIQRLLRY